MSRVDPNPDLQTLISQAREAARELRTALKDLKTAQREHETVMVKLKEEMFEGIDGAREEMRVAFKEGLGDLQEWQRQEHEALITRLKGLQEAYVESLEGYMRRLKETP